MAWIKMEVLRRLRLFPAVPALLLAGVLLQAQGTPPAAPLVLLSREGRRPVPTMLQSGQEFIALDDVASLFRVTVREDTLAGGVTVTFNGRSVVASPDQPMASVEGRLIALPSRALRIGSRWFVPVEFLSRALAPIYDTRIELRKAARLLIVGDLRVPRVTARIETPGPPTRVSIDISPAMPVTTTHDGARVLVRVEADAIDAILPMAGAGLVESIRPGELPASVIVQLRDAGGVNASTTPTAAGVRVALEVASPASGTPSPAPEPAAPAAPPPPPPIPGTPRPVLQTIAIDPGHGGDDTGVAGPGGTLEKQVTLELARRVKALIEARLGIHVLLTREDDRRMGVDERAAFANNNKADLLISLHANGTFTPAASGAEVFYLSLDPEMEDARRAARAEAATLPVLGGGTRTIDIIRWDMAQARHIDTSAVLAGLLEDALRARVPLGTRPLQQAPLRVLVGANMPAALIEVAYLTNSAQERQAASPEFQTSVAQAIYEAVQRFRAHLEAQR